MCLLIQRLHASYAFPVSRNEVGTGFWYRTAVMKSRDGHRTHGNPCFYGSIPKSARLSATAGNLSKGQLGTGGQGMFFSALVVIPYRIFLHFP